MKKNPIVLQVNVTANSGSTGRIAEQINILAQSRGWQIYFAYGRDMQPCKSKLIHVGNKWSVYEHYLESEIFDNDGLASRLSTRKFVREIARINPDIIHLHNIPGHWINYKILFEYLNTLNTPIVWTTHDPWPFTGCGHFSVFDCYRWRDGGCTNGCPRKKNHPLKMLFEKTEKHFLLKRDLIMSNKNLTIVPNSKWMEDMVRQSYLKNNKIVTILNGIDIDTFKPYENKAVLRKFGIDKCHYVVGVASVWYKNKGVDDYKKLALKLGERIKIVMVGGGLDSSELAKYGITVVSRTEDVKELTAIYTGAELVLNLSYQESFGLTSVEGYGCGRPTVVYNCTASPELVVGGKTGCIVEPGDIDGLVKAIEELMLMNQRELSEECRQRAEDYYDKNKKYMQYIELYETLLQAKNQAD